MAGGNLNPHVGVVRQNHGGKIRVHRRPASEEDGVLEHGGNTGLLGAALLVEQESGGDGGTLGVANDAIKGAFLLHDAIQVLDGLDRTPAGAQAALEEFAHCVLRAGTLGKVADLGQHILALRLGVQVIRLDEAIVRRVAEELLESLRREGLLGSVDEVERSGVVGLELLNEGCY